MMDAFAPFHVRPELHLSPVLLDWLAAAFRGEARPTPAVPDAQGLAIMAAHGLLPRLYICLRDTPVWPTLSPSLQIALAEAFQANAARAFLIENELRRVLAALKPDVPVALLKGMALGRAVYGSPAERPVSDVDLLVPPAAVDTAIGHFLSLGYRQYGLHGRGRSAAWLRRFRAEVPFLATVPGLGALLIEVHSSLVELPFYIEHIPSADVWEHTHPLGALSAELPDPVLLLLHACAHASFHHSSDLRLMWLLDIYQLAASPQLDWEFFLARAGAWRLGRACYETLHTASVWPGAAIPPTVLDAARALSTEPVSVKHWGLGDDRPGRASRKAWISLVSLPSGVRIRYLAWLASRVLSRSLEAGHNPHAPRTGHS
jgi:hypothetical protein